MSYNDGRRRKFKLFGWSMGILEWVLLFAALAYGVYNHFDAKKEKERDPQIAFVQDEIFPALRVQGVLTEQCLLSYSLSNLKNVNGQYVPGDIPEVVARSCREKAVLQHPLPTMAEQSK